MKYAQLGALLFVIASCGLWLWRSETQAPERGEPERSLMPVCCVACNKSCVMEVGRQPARCAECGKDAAWRAGRGSGCKSIYALDAKGVGSEGARKCPKCGKHGIMEIGRDRLPRKGYIVHGGLVVSG